MKTIYTILILYCFGHTASWAQTDALTIQPNGNVGVGTTTPQEKLQVNGNIKAEGRIQDKTGVIMPVGTVLPFAGSTPPEGWLLCDGKAYAKTGKAKDLYAIIGNRYGARGNTFKVPDLRNTFIMGANPDNDKLAHKGNPDVHTHKVKTPDQTFNTNEKGGHTHKFPSNWYRRNLSNGRYTGIDSGGSTVQNQTTQSSGKHTHAVKVALPGFNSGNSSGKNRPQWMALNYIIKY